MSSRVQLGWQLLPGSIALSSSVLLLSPLQRGGGEETALISCSVLLWGKGSLGKDSLATLGCSTDDRHLVLCRGVGWRGSCSWLLCRSRSLVTWVTSWFLFLFFFSYPQSMCEVLSPGLAVSVLKAIFQEVHVQVSSVTSHPPVRAPHSLGFWGWPARGTERVQWQCSS